MATYFKRKNKDRTWSIVTNVRVKGFKPTSRSFKTLSEAKAWAEPREKELKDQAKRGGARADISTITLGKLIEEFLEDPRTTALKSFEDLHNRLDWWSADPVLSTTKVMEFGVTQLRAARAKLIASGRFGKRAPGTVNRILSALRSCWNWGRSAGLIALERAWPTKLLLKEPEGRKVFLSADELATLLKAAESDPLVRAGILVSIATGIRQGELLLGLKWKDVDLDKGTITLHDTKNKSSRRVHVMKTAVEALTALREAPVVSAIYVFITKTGKPLKRSWLRQRWLKIRKAAGLPQFRWHDLRHSNASFLAQGGATLLEIGSALGHKSVATTKRYAHLVEGKAVRGHAELDALLRGAP
jgi:integrase